MKEQENLNEWGYGDDNPFMTWYGNCGCKCPEIDIDTLAEKIAEKIGELPIDTDAIAEAVNEKIREYYEQILRSVLEEKMTELKSYINSEMAAMKNELKGDMESAKCEIIETIHDECCGCCKTDETSSAPTTDEPTTSDGTCGCGCDETSNSSNTDDSGMNGNFVNLNEQVTNNG